MADDSAPHVEAPEAIRLRDMTCPQCRKPFQLRWQDTEWTDYRRIGLRRVDVTLVIRDCPSGGIYDVLISCPHCDYEEPL